MVTLLAQWRRMDGLAEEQSIMIDALSKERKERLWALERTLKRPFCVKSEWGEGHLAHGLVECRVKALGQDFSLNYPEIYVLCQSRAQSWNVIASLQCTLPNHRWDARA